MLIKTAIKLKQLGLVVVCLAFERDNNNNKQSAECVFCTQMSSKASSCCILDSFFHLVAKQLILNPRKHYTTNMWYTMSTAKPCPIRIKGQTMIPDTAHAYNVVLYGHRFKILFLSNLFILHFFMQTCIFSPSDKLYRMNLTSRGWIPHLILHRVYDFLWASQSSFLWDWAHWETHLDFSVTGLCLLRGHPWDLSMLAKPISTV